MKMNFISIFVAGWILFSAHSLAANPLPSWNDTKSKQDIIAFVEKVTTDGSPDFVPVAERIATFDNDGTLWCEQPIYVQLAFIFDRIKAMAPDHPEWKTKEPYASVLKGDLASVFGQGEAAVFELGMATHAGMTTDQFTDIVKAWIATARDRKTGLLYTQQVYQPMLELIAYLQANGFKTYIVSGGGIDFMRPWTEATYHIPPEQVIGSTIETKYEIQDGKPVLMRLPKVDTINDKEGKAVCIQRFIGRRPLFAFGNSDGDLQMLEWTALGQTNHFAGLVHHDDAAREYAYDRKSKIGTLDKAWDEAVALHWTVVSMKDDWNTIYPPVSQPNK
jgi:phosphoserine phosphatase